MKVERANRVWGLPNTQQPHYLQSKSLLAISFAAAAKGALCISGALLLVVKNAIKLEFNFRWMDVTQTRISKTFNIQEEEKVEKGNGSAISNKV